MAAAPLGSSRAIVMRSGCGGQDGPARGAKASADCAGVARLGVGYKRSRKLRRGQRPLHPGTFLVMPWRQGISDMRMGCAPFRQDLSIRAEGVAFPKAISFEYLNMLLNMH